MSKQKIFVIPLHIKLSLLNKIFMMITIMFKDIGYTAFFFTTSYILGILYTISLHTPFKVALYINILVVCINYLIILYRYWVRVYTRLMLKFLKVCSSTDFYAENHRVVVNEDGTYQRYAFDVSYVYEIGFTYQYIRYFRKFNSV